MKRTPSYKDLKKISKIELHRHLEASFPLSVAQKFLPKTIRAEDLCTTPSPTLEEVLEKFKIIQHAFSSKEAISTLSYAAVREAARDNIKILELRFSPSFMTEQTKLPWEEALEGVIEGTQKAAKDRGVAVGLLLISSRDYGIKSCKKTIDLALHYKKHIVGVDLAGPEHGFPPDTYQDEFLRAKTAGLHVTVHAGETEFPENVLTAVNKLGAERIGHGIQIINRLDILDEMIKRKIHFEISISSNYITQAVKKIECHPIKDFISKGLSVSINTDDPLFFNIDLTHEYAIFENKLDLASEDLKKVLQNTYEASFIAEDKKEKFKHLFY